MFRVTGKRAASTTVNLERLVGRAEAAEVVGSEQDAVPSDEGDTAAPASSAVPDVASDEGDAHRPDATDSADDEQQRGNEARRGSRDDARTHVARARAALEGGRVEEAETWFHRALQSDRTHPAALLGLSELYFEKGAYQRALRFAKRGVRAAPSSARHQLIYGDVCFKVLRYNDARAAYEAAKKLGSKSAQGRLDRLARTVGAK